MKGTPPDLEKKSLAMQLKCFRSTQNLEDIPPNVIYFMSLMWQEMPLLEILF